MKINGDHLTRIQTVEDLINIIGASTDNGGATAFSLEGEWGLGKTWIIDKVEDALKGREIFDEKDEEYQSLKNRYLVFKYNAWEKDYYEEPLLAILITMVNQLNQELLPENLLRSELRVLYEESKEILEATLRTISKRIVGVDVVDAGKKGLEIIKRIKGNAKIKLETTYSENVEKDIAIVVATLNKLSKYSSIVFIVDELDRCIPSHSIKTLERLHHVFGKVVPSVTLISINEKQLKNTVELMFGKNISFESYMRKFLDFRIKINGGETDNDELSIKLDSYYSLFSNSGSIELHEEILSNVCGFMTARDFEKVCANAKICHNLVQNSSEDFPKDCALAEILLFACKIAIEREGAKANILPIYANSPKTNLGQYLNGFLNKLSRYGHLDLTESMDLILYICAEGLELTKEMKLTYDMSNKDLLKEVENFYREYVRYYKLITL